MSVDNTLRALSYSEAPTLGVAMATIAKHRVELDAAMRAAELTEAPVVADGAAEQRAVEKVAAAVEAVRAVDKVA